MQPFAEALKRAGYETIEERIERKMADARERVEKLMGDAIDRRGLKNQSIAEFSRRLLEQNDAALIWEIFVSYRAQALSDLYDGIFAEKRAVVEESLKQSPQKTVGAVTPISELSSGNGSHPDGIGQIRSDSRGRLANVVGMGARDAVARRVCEWLWAKDINGQDLRKLKAREVREAGQKRTLQGRFYRWLARDLPDDEVIGVMSDAQIDDIYALALKANDDD